jgi:hypothetical protein
MAAELHISVFIKPKQEMGAKENVEHRPKRLCIGEKAGKSSLTIL